MLLISFKKTNVFKEENYLTVGKPGTFYLQFPTVYSVYVAMHAW